jgi:uncharacterized iron-regulated membrane protein
MRMRPGAPARSALPGWRRLHRWLGLSLGAWFALVGLSGAVLVFEDAIDAWLNPALLVSGSRGPMLPVQAIVERAHATYPLWDVEKIRFPTADGDVFRLTLRSSTRRVGAHRTEVTFDPVTGAHLGTRSLEQFGVDAPRVMRTLYEFHRNVLLGTVGSNVVGIAGALLLGSALTGAIVAMPRRRSGWRRLIGVKLRSGVTRALFDVHRAFGSTLCVLLMLATLTGITLVYLNYVRDLVGLFSKVAPFPTVPWRDSRPDRSMSPQQIYDRASRSYPESAISEIHVPSKATAGYLVYLRNESDIHRLGDTLVWMHSGSGEILLERASRNRTSGESFMHWLFPLHSGTAFGLPGRLAMCLTGIAPFVLVMTGLWVWSRKRRSERIEARRRSDARGNTSPRTASVADGTARGALRGR